MLFDLSRTGRSSGGGRVDAGGLSGSEKGEEGEEGGFVEVVEDVAADELEVEYEVEGEVDDVDGRRYRREAEAMRGLGFVWIRLELVGRRSEIAETDETPR